MVAVISGNDLGLGNTSLTQLGQTQGGSPSLGQAGNRSYVNTVTGNLILQSNDEGLLFDGLPLNVLRTYNSLGQLNGNDGWTYGFSRSVNGLAGTLNSAGSTITRTDDDGSSVVYTYNAALGVYQSTDQSGAIDTLSWNATSSTWTWTDAASTTQETYNATGQLTALTDTSSGASYSFSYSNGQLSQIVAGDGDTLIFGYNTNNQLISLSIQEIPPGQSTAVTRQAVTYGYDTQGRLTSVTTTLGSDTDSTTASYTTTYAYQGTTDLISSVTQSDGTAVSYSYTQDAQGAYQVTGIITGTGSAEQTLTLSYDTNDTTVIDGLGNASYYQYNSQGQLTYVNTPVGATTYTYDANGNLLTSTDLLNRAVTSYQYDANGNLLSVEDGAGNTVSYTYNTNDQITSKTVYTVPAQGEVGQSGYVAPGGAEITYYVYNTTNQLAYTIDAVGNVSENDYTAVNGLSELTTSRQYLGATYSPSSNSNSPSNPPTLTQLQSWVASSAVQNTLSQSTRTDLTYDMRGQLATQTQYDTVTSSGAGVLTNGTVITTTTYDAQGRLLHTSTETGANRTTLQTTAYAYDGMGRMISKTDPLGNVTSYVYIDNGSNDTLTITQANGLITTQVRNSGGLLISSIQTSSLAGASYTLNYEVIYNTAGQTVAVTNTDGSANYTFYNAQGQVAGKVNNEGDVTSYAYDSNGYLSQTIEYATTVNTSGWISNGALTASFPGTLPVPASSSSDLISTSIYDANGHVVATIAPNGSVVQNIYGSAGQLTSSIAYATPLSPTQVTQLGSAPSLSSLLNTLTTSSSDKTTLTIYNSSGQIYAVVDGSGNVTLDNYDASGNRIASVTLGTPLTAAQLQALYNNTTTVVLQADLAQNRGAQTNFSIYNSANQMAATVSPGGVVTGLTYDGSGRVIARTTYATALTAQQMATLADTPTFATLQGLITLSSNDTTSLTIYNATGEIAATVGGAGNVTTTIYDASGKLLGSTQYATALTASQIRALGTQPTYSALLADLTPSAADQTSLTIYDANGNAVGIVTYGYGYNPQTNGMAFGENVVINTYDTSGRLLTTTQYNNQITAAQADQLTSNPTIANLQSIVTPSVADLTNITIYNDDGTVAATVAPVYQYIASTSSWGYTETITTMTYDTNKRVVATTTYATPLTQQQAETLAQNPTLANLQSFLASNTAQPASFTVYSADGLESATVTYQSGQGQVTVTNYDAQGSMTAQIQYVTQLTADQLSALGAQPSLQAVLADVTPSDNDQYSFWIYDSNENVVAEIDSQWTSNSYTGQVTTYTYDAGSGGNSITHYSNGLTYTQVQSLGMAPTLAQLDALLQPSEADQISLTIKSEDGSSVASIQTESVGYDSDNGQQIYGGQLIIATLDAQGNVISRTTFNESISQGQLRQLALTPTWAALEAQLPSAGGVVITDATGRVVVAVDSNGSVKTFTYNGSAATATTYSHPLTLQQQRQLAASPTLATLTLLMTGTTAGITVLGSNGQVLGQVSATGIVTLMTYDTAGHRVGTTQYATALSAQQMEALASSPSLGALQIDLALAEGGKVAQTLYDDEGRPIASISADGSVVATTYDAAGNASKVTQYANPLSPVGYVATYTQLLSELIPSSKDVTTRTVYDANRRAVAVIDTNGYVTLNTYDANGNVISQTKNRTPLTSSQLGELDNNPTLASLQALLAPTTQYIYNAAGQKIATIDPQGNVSYTFYDADGRVSGEVYADGDVITYGYDSAGNVTRTAKYNLPLDTSSWVSNGALTSQYPSRLIPPGSWAYATTAIYDAGGRKVATIDSAGYVTTFTYDGTGKILATTQYATALTANQRAALGGIPSLSALQAYLAANVSNRTTLAIYDADGRKVASIDGDGYVTIARYNTAGEQVITTAYASGLTSSQLASLGDNPTLVALQADLTSTVKDQTTRSYYDDAGRLVAQIDADGYLTTTSYDTTTLTDTTTRYATALTASQLNALTGSESLGELVGLLGNTTGEQSSVTYNGNGEVASSTAADGTVITYTYNSMGQVLSTTVTPVSGQGIARTTSATYDVYGNELTSTDAAGAITTYVYDTLGRKIETTDAAGNSTWYYYDAAGLLLYTVQGQPDSNAGIPNTWGDVTALVYNAFGQVTQSTTYTAQLVLTTSASSGFALNPTGASPDQVAIAIAALEAANSGVQIGITTYTQYDNDDRVSYVTDGDNYTTGYFYDAFGELTDEFVPVSHSPSAAIEQTFYNYDNDGRILSVGKTIDSQMYESNSAYYDAFGRVIDRTDSAGNTVTYTYDNLGRQVAANQYVQGMERATNTTYDAFGHVLTTTDALGNVTTYQYDIATHTTAVTTPGGVVMTTVKDAYGDTISVTDGSGNTTSYTYDADGRLLTTKDALGNVSTNQYDLVGDLIQTIDATGHVVTYTYDASGKVLTKTIDPAGLDEVTRYAYDGMERLLSVTDPVGTVTTYSYDADGNVLTMVEDAGPGGLNLATIYTYDHDGDVLTVTQGAGTASAVTTQYVYNQLDELVQKTVDPNGLALTTRYVYDYSNNLVEVVDPSGNTTYTVYNEAGQLVYTVTPAGGHGAGLGAVTQNSYDADGRLIITRTYSTLVSTSQLSGVFLGGQYAMSLVAGAVHASPADATTYYVYNANGQQIYKIDPLGNVTETRYNQLGQVAETLAYADPIALGNTLASALQNGMASIASIRATIASIQAALASAGNSDASARITYSYYDADGRLTYTAVLTQVDGVLGAVVSQTQYDAAGRIIANVTYGVPLALDDVGSGATTASVAQALAASGTAATTRSTQYLYDSAGQQVAVIDPNGVASYTFYDAAGRVAATVDGAGAVTEYVRDDLGRVLRKMTFNTTVDTSGWIAGGKVQAGALPVFDPNDGNTRIVDTTYDALGRVTSVTTYSRISVNGTSYNSPTSGYAYLTVDDVIDGDKLVYNYDTASRVTATSDLDLSGETATRVTRVFYDADGNTIATLDAIGYLTTQTYDAAGQLIQTVAYATQVNPSLAANGTVAQLMPPSSASDQITTNYYDANGNLVGTLDAKGYFTGYTYDLDGNQLTATRYATALNPTASLSLANITAALTGSAYHQTSNTYDAYGDLLSSQNYQGTVTSYVYDNTGNVLSKTVASGTNEQQSTSYTYDAFSNVASVTDALGNVANYAYDLAGNKTSMTDAMGNVTWYVYDAVNRLCFTIRGIAQGGVLNALGEVSAVDYDAFGDVQDTITYSALMGIGAAFAPSMAGMKNAVMTLANTGINQDEERSYIYDLEGNEVVKRDGNNNETSYTYDGFNEVISKKQGGWQGLTTLYAYDGMGSVTGEIDEIDVGGCGEFGVAAEEMISNSGGVQILREQNWTYDAFGNVATYTDGNNNTTSYTYDDLDQQVSQSLTVSDQVRETADTYDAYGRILTSTDAEGLVTSYSYGDATDTVTETQPGGITTVTAYNSEGQITSVTDAQGNVTSYTYDADGRLAKTTNPDGSTVANQYDADGHLVQTTDADGNVTAYTYDAAGHMLSKIVDPNGLDLQTTYTYDGRGLMTSDTDPTGVVTDYGYDGNGNVSYVDRNPNSNGSASLSTDYTYNDLNEVVSSTVWGMVNDAWQNASSNFSYDVLGRMTSETTDTGHQNQIQYTYDGDGNVTTKTDGDGNVTYYFYNEANQQTYVVAPNGAVTATTYNAGGQVTSTTQYATELSSNVMAWDLSNASSYQMQYIVTASPDDRTSYNVYNSAGRLEYSIDPNGNVTQVLYNTLGQVAETIAYASPVQLSAAGVTDLQSGASAAIADVQAALAATGNTSDSARITYTYYDAMGRVSCTLSSASLDGQSGYLAVQTEYDANGNAVAAIQHGDLVPSSLVSGNPTTATVQAYLATLPDSHATQSVYDNAGRLIYSIDTAGNVTQTEYDNDGRVTATLKYAYPIAAPAAWTQDDVAAAVQATNANSTQTRETRNFYDDFGNLIETIDPDGNTTSYTYDERGLKLSSTDSAGNITYTYDQHGNLIAQTSSPVMVNIYSSPGVLQGKATESIVTTYQYDNAGNLITRIDASNTAQARTTQFQYDAAGNLTQTIQADPDTFNAQTGQWLPTAVQPTTTVTYNAFGQAVATQDANGNVTYNVYDHDGSLLYAIDGDGYVTGYTYNAYGQQTSVTQYATGINAAGQGWSINQPPTLAQLSAVLVTSSADRTTTTAYDVQGNKISVISPAVTYANSADSAAGGVETTEYTYDAYGNVTSQSLLMQGTAGTASAEWAITYNYYDALGNMLMSVDPMGYVTANTYDTFGDILSTTHYATTIDTSSLAAGAQPELPPTSAQDHVTVYTYDNNGNVLSKTADPNGLNLVTSYTYDGRGLMTSQTDPAGVVTQFTYDANGNVSTIVQDINGATPITTTNTYDALGRLVESDVTQTVGGIVSTASSYYTYDVLGRVVAETTDTGHQSKVVYTYDANGNVISKTDGNGNVSYAFYDADNRPIYAVAANGAITATTYNAEGQVTSTTQYAAEIPVSSMSQLVAGDTGSLTALIQTSADDRTSCNVYNNAGQLEYSIDPNGNVTGMLYNAQGQVLETLAYPDPVQLSAAAIADIQSGAATAEADVQAVLSAAGNDSGNARLTYTYYDADGRVSCTLSSASLDGQSGYLAVQTEYDAEGNVTAKIQYGDLIPATLLSGSPDTATVEAYLAGLADMHATRTVYDNDGRAVYSIDAAGHVTQTEYDKDGRVTATLKYANAIGTPAAWTQADVASAVQAANASHASTRETQNVYDDFGNLTQTIDANGNATSYTYDERGLKLSSTDGNGNTTYYTYDQYGNLLTQTSPPVAVASYSSSGAYQGTTAESIVTIYTYDAAGNLITQVDASNTPEARTTQFKYDAAGNLIQTIQADPGAIDPQTGLLVATGSNPTITVTYNAFGQAVASEDANGNTAYNVYDHDGNLLYAIDGDGYVTGYTYNAYGEQTSATRYATSIDMVGQGWNVNQPPSLAQVQAALVTSSSDRTLSTTYDAQGNKLSVTEPVITYTNNDGSTAQGSPVTQYTYDAYGNVTSQSVLVQGAPGAAGAVWATTFNYYDALGNKLMSVDPMGYVTTNTYDAFGDVLSTTQWATAISTTDLVAGGAMPSDPSSVVGATTGLDRIVTYTYDQNGNKTSQSVQRSYTNAQGQATVGWDTTNYAYDGNNHLTTITENGITTATTAYDAMGRVISVTGPQVEVLVSNWQAMLEANPSLTLASPSLYVLASQVVSYTYDTLGNKLLQTQSSTTSSQTVSTYYQYDNAGHVVAQITPLDGSGANWTSSQAKFMAYDGNGNLIEQWYTLDGDDNSSTTVTTLNTYDGDNQQVSSVTYRAGIPEPDKATSTTYDAFGEVIASGDGVTNNVVTTYDNAGNKLTSTDPKTGELHTYGYNLAGQLVSDTVPLAASVGGTAQTLYTLDLDGRVTAEQAPSTNAVSGENAGILIATYDAWGNVLSSRDANGNTTTYAYNERNDVVTETEAAVTVVNADGSSASRMPQKTTSYDIYGNVIASTDENGNAIHNSYNLLGQKTESIDGAGNVLYTGYDALGNQVAQQDGNGNITFSNIDALGRAVQSGEFELSSDGSSRQAVWQQAYVLDQNGDRIISYDGIGSAYLQSGDATDAALHASYAGYNSQGKVIWSQDAAQHAASTASDHQDYTGNWTQTPPNSDFSQGSTGWDASPGWVFGSWNYDGQNWSVKFNPSNLSNGGSGTLVSTDRVPVVPGQVITANGNTEVQSTNGWGSMEIVWYDAQGNVISVSTDQNSPGHEQDGRRGAGTAWVTGTAPAGAAWAAMGLNAGNYNEGDPGVTFSQVWWSYTPPADISVLGSGNTGAVVSLPTGQFTDQAQNTNFAQGNTGWDTNGWTIHQASNANSGWEASFGGNGTATMVNQDRVPVTVGQTIIASMQLSLYLAPDGAAAGGAVAINWYDASGNLITTQTGNWVDNDHKGAWETSTVVGTAPAGAAYASLAVVGSANGIGSISVENAQWNYQYIPQVPTGVVEDMYVYDMDGNLVSETTADGDTESWQYNPYGQVTQHTDLSGANYNYTYDANTGAQIGESDNWSPTAQGQVAPAYATAPLTTPNSETLTYYADGQIATETFSDGSSYSYQYDNNGNLIREEDSTVDGNDNTVHTVTQTSYDSHNRITHVVETNAVTGTPMLDETFSYDAAGNRREVRAVSQGSTQDAWYTYDGDNRVEIADGSLQNGQIVVTSSTGSYENAYDADGNVIKLFTRSSDGDLMAQTQRYNALNQLFETDYAVDVTQGATNNGIQQTISYDADGHALVTQNYYELGATITVQNNSADNPPDDEGPDTSTVDVGGELQSATVNFYDVVGRLAESQTFNTPSGWDGTSDTPTGIPNPDATSYGSLTLQSEVVYQGPNGTSGYDADGDVVAYQYRDATGRVDQYQVTYFKKDTYLQADTTGDSNVANVQPATDQSVYDTRGNQVALEQHTEDPYGNIADTVRVFAYNGNGEIIESESGTGSSGSSIDLGSNPQAEIANYTYVNGQQLASFNNDGSNLNVLDQVTAFSSNNDSPNSYVVQSGDTLESIAQAEYGNSNLWYVIAQANDLSSDTNLVLGQRLQIPAVTTHSNSATTFKPYDPSGIIGSTTPNLPTIAPPPPPAGNGGCSVAQILVLVVTIVVTVVTWGSTSGLLVGELGEFAGDVAAGALAGAAGSLAGQLVGNATGIENGIDWSSVGLAALGGAITGGVTGGLQSSDLFTTGELNSAGMPILNGWGTALQAAGSYVGTDVADHIAGQPAHFSWAGLIASTAAAGVGYEVTDNLPAYGAISAGLDQATGRVVGDVVGRELSVAFGDKHVPSWAQVGEQAAGEFIADPLDSWIEAPTQDQIQARAIQNYIGQHGGNVFAAFPYQGDGSVASEDNGTVPVTPITGSNGESGFQAQDGFQTFPLQGGASNSSASGNLPGPFSTAPSYYLVQNGDSLTTILGSSDPAMIGMEERLNGMSGSTIYAGKFLALGTSADVQAGDAAAGQKTLNQDDAVIAAQNLQQVSGGVVYSGPDLAAQGAMSTSSQLSDILSAVGSVANYATDLVAQHPSLALAAQTFLFGSGANSDNLIGVNASRQDYPASSVSEDATPGLVQMDSELLNNDISALGSLAGVGKAAITAIADAGQGMVNQYSAFEDALFGKSGLNVTNVFQEGAQNYYTSANNTLNFFENHPLTTVGNAASNWWDQTTALSLSDDPYDRWQAGMRYGEASFFVVTTADGAYGLAKAGTLGAWNGLTKLSEMADVQPPLISAANAATDSEAGMMENASNATVTTASDGAPSVNYNSGVQGVAELTVAINSGEASGSSIASNGTGTMVDVPPPVQVDVPPGQVDVSATQLGVPLDQDTFDAIRAMEPGTRPDPTTYLPKNYINDQLGAFDEGGSYLVPKDILDKYGRDILGMPDNSQFMMPKSQMDEMLARTGGDAAAIERELGIPEGQWQGRELARIDVNEPVALNLRMPSGNEMGANSEWLPGGKLSTGLTEGVTDRIPVGQYVERSLGQGILNSERALEEVGGNVLNGRDVPNNIGVLRSPNDLMGVEPASPELLTAISAKRSLIIAQPGSDELRMLDYFGAEASVGGVDNSSILLRQNPSKAAVLEEFLHGTQSRLGVIDRLGTSGYGSAETHVKDFMIRHQTMLGLSDEDVRILQVLRDKGL